MKLRTSQSRLPIQNAFILMVFALPPPPFLSAVQLVLFSKFLSCGDFLEVINSSSFSFICLFAFVSESCSPQHWCCHSVSSSSTSVCPLSTLVRSWPPSIFHHAVTAHIYHKWHYKFWCNNTHEPEHHHHQQPEFRIGRILLAGGYSSRTLASSLHAHMEVVSKYIYRILVYRKWQCPYTYFRYTRDVS